MMESEKKLIRNKLLNLNEKDIVANTNFQYVKKNSEVSIQARQKGNALYGNKDHSGQTHEVILNFYSKSIAFAPNESEELALAYGNRSALLLHLRKYEKCIEDIDKAICITKSTFLKVKLLCRKVQCLTLLGSSDNEISFQEAIESFNKIRRSDESQNLIKILNKTKLILEINSVKSIPKENKKIKFTNISSDKEKMNVSKFIDVKYSKKYGRHLVASQNFKPGDIIFIEKPYAVCPNIKVHYIYCSYCLAIAWTGIPCKSCSLSIFCSEKCKKEAWKKYHSIECSIIPYMTRLNKYFVHNFKLSIRILIMGIKEFGDISKLKNELESFDECTDKSVQDFYAARIFRNDDFRHIYSLTHDIPEEQFEMQIQNTAIALVYITKNTPLIRLNNLKNETLHNLAKNEDVIFIGALLLRLIKISFINHNNVFNSMQDCEHVTKPMRCLIKQCHSKGICLSPFSSLINNSCVSNAKICFTEDQKIIVYAVEPITKNSQIFNSYLCNFYDTPSNMNRKATLKKYFYFSCNCIACERNWSPLRIPTKDINNKFFDATKNLIENKLTQEYKEIIISVLEKKVKLNETTIKNLAIGIEEATKHLPQPSTIRSILVLSLQRAFEKLYGYNVQPFIKC